MTWLIMLCIMFGFVMGLAVFALLDMHNRYDEDRNHD